jgi:hypothetical protein
MSRFLLARLHLESLVGKWCPRAIRVALTKLPTGSRAYDESYEDSMERCQTSKSLLCKFCHGSYARKDR